MRNPVMKVPLLIGGRPRYMKESRGPLVPLGEGNWNVTGNHKDSQVFVICQSDEDAPVTFILQGSLVICGPTWARVIVNKVGSEDYIDIYAERIV